MRFAAIVLAAGSSSRYLAGGGPRPTKLIEDFAGEPMIAWASRAATAAGASPVVVVTGHARAEVEAALAGQAVRFVHNAGFAAGLSTSLRTGLRALDDGVEAALILLGDMPRVGPDTIARLAAAARAHPHAQAVVPLAAGGRGNPVLLRRALFTAAAGLAGDEGARRLLRDPAVTVLEVAMDGDATRFDIDTADGFPPS